MRILVIAVGERGPKWVTESYKTYADRLRKPWIIELKEISTERRGNNSNIGKIINSEGSRILAAVPNDYHIVALDQRGVQFTTEKLSDFFLQWNENSQNVVFLVGGPDGLSAEVLDRADNVWALSQFTMASSVARLVIFEQIYRAISILLGLPYHRGSS